MVTITSYLDWARTGNREAAFQASIDLGLGTDLAWLPDAPL
jgi:hypothetical protein